MDVATLAVYNAALSILVGAAWGALEVRCALQGRASTEEEILLAILKHGTGAFTGLTFLFAGLVTVL